MIHIERLFLSSISEINRLDRSKIEEGFVAFICYTTVNNL